jgi:hypothetical protein
MILRNPSFGLSESYKSTLTLSRLSRLFLPDISIYLVDQYLRRGLYGVNTLSNLYYFTLHAMERAVLFQRIIYMCRSEPAGKEDNIHR